MEAGLDQRLKIVLSSIWPEIKNYEAEPILGILIKKEGVYFQYKDGEEVVLWVNTVGPYHNRQETYAYFSLPFCQGPKQYISHYHETLGEALQGTELEFSGLDIQFKSKHNI